MPICLLVSDQVCCLVFITELKHK